MFYRKTRSNFQKVSSLQRRTNSVEHFIVQMNALQAPFLKNRNKFSCYKPFQAAGDKMHDS